MVPRCLRIRWAPSRGYMTWRWTQIVHGDLLGSQQQSIPFALFHILPPPPHPIAPSSKKETLRWQGLFRTVRQLLPRSIKQQEFSRIQNKNSEIIQPFLNPLPMRCASPRSLKFPSASSQTWPNCVPRQRSMYAMSLAKPTPPPPPHSRAMGVLLPQGKINRCGMRYHIRKGRPYGS